jgi:hypothetical protein
MLPGNLPALAVGKPMVLLTGFLGAGKTSFLRGVLDAVKESGQVPDDRFPAVVGAISLAVPSRAVTNPNG